MQYKKKSSYISTWREWVLQHILGKHLGFNMELLACQTSILPLHCILKSSFLFRLLCMFFWTQFNQHYFHVFSIGLLISFNWQSLQLGQRGDSRSSSLVIERVCFDSHVCFPTNQYTPSCHSAHSCHHKYFSGRL